MFFGRYDYTIDAKGRLNFPAKFRDAMGESFVVLEWVDNCLFVLPLPEVEKLAEKLEADELMDSWEVSGDLFSTPARWCRTSRDASFCRQSCAAMPGWKRM